jgi:hypothetical protein
MIKNKNYKKKKYKIFFLYLVGCLIFIGFFLKIFITFYSKQFVKTHFIDEYILSKYSKEIRYDQFYLLEKNKTLFETYLFCTSACLVMNPDSLIKNSNGFNLSLGAGQISDYLKYFKWILKNKSTPKNIFIGLEFYSLSNNPFMKFTPHEVEDNMLSKVRNLYLDVSFEKFLISKFILGYDIQLNKDELKKLNFAKNGSRLFSKYFERKNDKSLFNKHIEKLKNQKISSFVDEISSSEFAKFNELLDLAQKNNISVSVFFIPIHVSHLTWNKGSIFNDEVNLIKEIFDKTSIEKITYFNNFNEINKNMNFYEHDLTHMNYDAARLIEADLKNETNITGMHILKNELNSKILELKKQHENY